jgi:hypothetical protein
MAGAELTIREAADWLDPPISADALTVIVRALGIKPAGKRHAAVGRPPLTYDASLLIDLHTALVPFLTRPAAR